MNGLWAIIAHSPPVKLIFGLFLVDWQPEVNRKTCNTLLVSPSFYLSRVVSVDVHVSRRHTHSVAWCTIQNAGLLFFQYFQSYLKKICAFVIPKYSKSPRVSKHRFRFLHVHCALCIVHMVTGLVCSIAISITWGHKRIFQNIVPNIEFYLFRVLNAGLMHNFSEYSYVRVVSLRRIKVFFIFLMAGTLTVYHWPMRPIKVKKTLKLQYRY